jgi:hypothetical protein
MAEYCRPKSRLYNYIQEAFDHIEAVNGRLVLHQPVADLLADGLRRFACHLDPGENHDRQIAFKFLFRCLRLDGLGIRINPIKFFDRTGNALRYDIIYRHCFSLFCNVLLFNAQRYAFLLYF